MTVQHKWRMSFTSVSGLITTHLVLDAEREALLEDYDNNRLMVLIDHSTGQPTVYRYRPELIFQLSYSKAVTGI